MGIDRWTYLGPYAELTLPLKTTRHDTCRQPDKCPNVPHGFCSTCGMEIKKRYHEFQDTDPSLPSILTDVLSEALFTADGIEGPEQPNSNTVIYRLVPNVTRSGQLREFHVDEDASFWRDLTHFSTQDEIAWFEDAFAPEWSALREVYGDIHFKWGLLQWFH